MIPKVKETFGNLSFGSEKTENFSRGRNPKLESRTYHLFSDVQRADDVEVTIPVAAGNKKLTFKAEDRVQLINPRVAAIGYRIEDQAFVRYECYADDIVKL